MNESKTVQATSFREYIATMKDEVDIVKWLWKEATTTESRKFLRIMIGWLALSAILQAFAPGTVRYVFMGLESRDSIMVAMAIAASFLFTAAIKKLEMKQDAAREWALGKNWLQLDDGVTEIFFGKSVAQHTHESKKLAASTIDKGKWRMIEVQDKLLFDCVPLVLNMLSSLLLLYWFSRIAGLIMTINLALYLYLSLKLNYRASKEGDPIDEEFRAVNRRRAERMEHYERVKTCGHEKLEKQEMSVMLGDVIGKERALWLWFINASWARSMVNNLSYTAVMAYGAWLIWKGDWKDIGMLYPLYTWASRLSDNMWKFGDIEFRIRKNVPSVKSTIEALSLKPEITDKPDAIVLDHTVPHRIVLEKVSHTYPAELDASNEVSPTLQGIDLVIETGESVAIMGPSGAGKTTMIKLLLRFCDPTSGRITIGGHDLRDITQSSYKRGIGYASQQAAVLDGTIRDNLVYGLNAEERKSMKDERLLEITKLLKIDFKSLDTVVGRNGLKLSGGQAQRLMLGAAVAKNPWLLVIDEGTASLDSITEKAVQAGLATLSESTSALIITHRLNTVRNLCDKFVVLRPAAEVKEGEIQVEAVADSFEDLYAISPTFRRLADAQGVSISVRESAIA